VVLSGDPASSTTKTGRHYITEIVLKGLVSLPTEDGGLYHIVTDVSFTLEDGTQIVYFYGEQSIVSTESSAVSINNNQSFSDIIASNVGIVAAVVVTAVVVASSGSSDNDDNDDDNDKLCFTLIIIYAYRTRFCRNDRLLTIKIHALRAIF
jgi:hypothetical protein